MVWVCVHGFRVVWVWRVCVTVHSDIQMGGFGAKNYFLAVPITKLYQLITQNHQNASWKVAAQHNNNIIVPTT